MNLLTYLVGLVLVSIIAGACLAAILIYFNPFTSGLLVFILFYLSLFIASTSVFTLIGWIIRIISKKRKFPLPKKEAIYRFEVSFRQGMFLSAILIASLILQGQKVLSWWNLLILMAVVGLSEWWLSRR